MLSRAKGRVAINPRYVAATDKSESFIHFRLRCDYSINLKNETEFYSVKAFGKVADFLHNTVKMDSELYIEAIARTTRYTEKGQSVSRIDFHIFMARDIASNTSIDTRSKDEVVSDSSACSTEEVISDSQVFSTEPQTQDASPKLPEPSYPVRSPELQKRLDAELVLQQMPAAEVSAMAERWRNVLNEVKSGIASEPGTFSAQFATTQPSLASSESKKGFGVTDKAKVSTALAVQHCNTEVFSGEATVTKTLLAARAQIKQRATGGAQVRN